MDVFPVHSAIQDLWNGACAGVFVDDTGSPGLPNTPKHLSQARKSWAAVIVPRLQIAEVMEQFPQALEELHETIGATEFHFTHIYQGRKQFEETSPETRMALFEFMAHIFETYGFPVLVQTLDPDKRVTSSFRDRAPRRFGRLDLHDYGDLALVLLILRARRFLLERLGESRARLFLDEGRFQAGSSWTIPGLDPPFTGGQVYSVGSSELHPLQLADFAAFTLNRTQLVSGWATLKPLDAQLLQMLTSFANNYKNIVVHPVNTDEWPPFSEAELAALTQEPDETS